jgi:hypothetical protein
LVLDLYRREPLENRQAYDIIYVDISHGDTIADSDVLYFAADDRRHQMRPLIERDDSKRIRNFGLKGRTWRTFDDRKRKDVPFPCALSPRDVGRTARRA